MLTPVSMELRTPPLELKIPRAVATTVWPSSSSSSSSRALGLKGSVWAVFKVPKVKRRSDRGGSRAGFSPHGDGFGHGVDVVVVLVLGALVHGASEGIHAAVVVCVLGRRRYLRLQRAGAAHLHVQHSSGSFRTAGHGARPAGPDLLVWSRDFAPLL